MTKRARVGISLIQHKQKDRNYGVYTVGFKILSDYGILNFTGGTGFRVTIGNPAVLATTTLDAVDLSKNVSILNRNGDNRNKLKTELVEKTGLYINKLNGRITRKGIPSIKFS